MPCEPSDRLRSRDPYRLVDGLYVPPWPVLHRSENYEASHLAMLRDMEDRHFWYRGRHRFLLHAVHAELGRARAEAGSPRLIDLGGGCGGWLRYLLANKRFSVAEAALGDSSTTALEHARERLPSEVGLYHLDLLGLRWNERWELAFLLDVLEHIPEDGKVLSEVYRSLCPGGVLFVTVPALDVFWTWNDEAARHQRRYAKRTMSRLAREAGFTIRGCRYFMFFLSPLLLGARWFGRPRDRRPTPAQMNELLCRAHRTPSRLVNGLLWLVFAAETPLGHALSLPWGTSLLAVLQKPF